MSIENEFTQIIKENESLIFKITTIYACNKQDREDLFQEIVIQLWKAFSKFRNESKISTWIYRVALNTAISGFRKQKKRIDLASIDWFTQNYSENSTTEQEDRVKSLYQYIETLNALDKGIILLFLEDKSHKEISEIIGLSKTNIGTRLSRIRQKIKSQMFNS